MRGAILEKTMEMQRGGLVAQLIVDIDGNILSKRGSHHWWWPLIVDSNRRSLEQTIGIRSDPGDVEVVGYGSRTLNSC